jgi:hypothetical protein
VAVLATFTATEQRPPSAGLEQFAHDRGQDPGAVPADVLAFTGGGDGRVPYPFYSVPTPIRVVWVGGPQGICGVLNRRVGMVAVLGYPVSLTAAEPGADRITPLAEREPGTLDAADHGHVRRDGLRGRRR